MQIDTDITWQKNIEFLAEAERQWENLNGQIPFHYGEWITVYLAACWMRFNEKVQSN